jgi:hypothetical protein
MDNRGGPPPEPRKGLLSGRYNSESAPLGPQPPEAAQGQPNQPPGTGGLLSRFGAQSAPRPEPQEQRGGEQGWRGLAGGARKLGDNLRRMTSGAPATRAPKHRDWRATDFSDDQIDEWDQYGDAPFNVPPDPDAPRQGSRSRARSTRNVRDEWDDDEGNASSAGWDEEWDRGGEVDWDNAEWEDERSRRGGRDRGGRSQSRGGGRYDDRYDDGYDDRYDDGYGGYGSERQPAATQRGGRNARQDEWDDEWNEGGQRGQRADDSWDLVGDLRDSFDPDAITDTLAQLGAISTPISRMARIRLLMRRRPAAAAMLAFCLLGFMLTCCAPIAPLIRLGFDTADLVRRADDLRALTAGGVTNVINASNLSRAQQDVASIQSDLYEINGAVAVVGAPAAAVSHTARDYQLLIRMGYDLTGAASEALQIAQMLVTPLEGGALSNTNGTPGITPADIQQSRVLLSDAYARALDAIQAYQQLDLQALPAQLKPGSRYGEYLAQLPLAVKAFAEMKDLIDAAPALLGVGQPAYYLAIALDNSELRPGGGFQGNYGLLEIDGGKQSKTNQFALTDTYKLDEIYTQNAASNPLPSNCLRPVTQPTNLYWWWPVRCLKQYGWGLRDADLSADFPTNARLAMQIAEVGGATPNGAPIQGVVAFTPGLIQDLLNVTGDLPMPGYKNQDGSPVIVTPQNLQFEIHYQQLRTKTSGERKQFTHDLSKALLDRLKGMHGSSLKTIFKIATDAIKSKDLQVYVADPRAELVLQQLGIDSSVATGNGDGYFVVDTNDGGSKANLYVTESQTDYVTLLPNGGAFHRLEISVTYDKKGDIFDPGSIFEDYSDVQRTYMPGDATIVGWSGFDPSAYFTPTGCSGSYATIVTDCSPDHGIITTTTGSDVAGRTMVQGALLVMCGSLPQNEISAYGVGAHDANGEYTDCTTNPQPHTQNIFISWYTPNAYTVDANGHGTYTELIEKQAGDIPNLMVYVSRGSLRGPQIISDTDTFSSLIAHTKSIFNGPLAQNETISYSF